ncbi:transglycosylase SLT domain-containing protein [Blastococcus sp. TF02A-30]|uniref:aggregation-promoting factor C-terminal-like domain-containing protein n=1 Tax=Blastococcus sp. TF02A-30 TaxID=2250580 RepID=UPI000DE96A87|nr:transglycosylase SLT domain-containing protein [Blastococcus sp. TF02A-30]RBY87875.1 lytic transglycosylase domain-containing protein [Blastococcus sp. TF02A-30]
MNLRTTMTARRRPAALLAVAAAGAIAASAFTAGEPAAHADAPTETTSVAQALGVDAQAAPADDVAPLEELAASRSERDAQQAAAAEAQAVAEQAERDRIAAEEAAARAAAEEAARAEAARVEAARQAEAQAAAAAARPGRGTTAAVAPAGSYKDYAMQKLGGAGSEFTCLENLWGKESGWNPNAQNPSSTAYGIAQFLDSTWAGTGIAKTSDGYRQIDAGLIYINNRFGSPCGAWAHSQAKGWY